MFKRLITNSQRTKAAFGILVSIIMILSILTPTCADARTLFSYNGTGIFSKASIGRATISDSTCTVVHTQKREYDEKASMKVRIERKAILGWKIEASKAFYNDVTKKKFTTFLRSGTYRLYFDLYTGSNRFTIKGKFTN